MSIRAQILAKEVKQLIDLLLITDNNDDRITVDGAIRLKLKMIREILDGKNQ
tara:strand:- start:240 stop:395 length:156 start_codon:yes stop_codon:yes gene_type:complete